MSNDKKIIFDKLKKSNNAKSKAAKNKQEAKEEIDRLNQVEESATVDVISELGSIYDIVEAETVDQEPQGEEATNDSNGSEIVLSEVNLPVEVTEKVVVRKIKEDTTSALNGFDMFFVKLWSYIVAFIAAIANGINFIINAIFKRKAPDKYVRAAVSIILIILLILLFTLPFKIEVNAGETVDVYSDGLLPVSVKVYVNNKQTLRWGFVNKKGDMVIPAIYAEALPFMHGVAWVRTHVLDAQDQTVENYWSLIDKKGKPKGKENLKFDHVTDIVRPNNEAIRPVGMFTKDSKLAWVYLAGKYGYINTAGKMAISPFYDYAEGFVDGLACVEAGTRWYFINRHGDKIGDYYEEVRTFSEGHGAVMMNERWGFINIKGKMVIDPQYDAVSSFKGGYAAVRRGMSYGIIDYKNNEIVQLSKYNDLMPLSDAMQQLIDSIKLDR